LLSLSYDTLIDYAFTPFQINTSFFDSFISPGCRQRPFRPIAAVFDAAADARYGSYAAPFFFSAPMPILRFCPALPRYCRCHAILPPRRSRRHAAALAPSAAHSQLSPHEFFQPLFISLLHADAAVFQRLMPLRC
jgi:hypothetical protein